MLRNTLSLLLAVALLLAWALPAHAAPSLDLTGRDAVGTGLFTPAMTEDGAARLAQRSESSKKPKQFKELFPGCCCAADYHGPRRGAISQAYSLCACLTM